MDLPTASIMARKIGFTRKRMEYETRGETPATDKHMPADVALAKRIGETLERHYPSHPWKVEVDHRQGVVMISLPIVMPQNQKYVIHTATIAGDPGLRSVIRAGGEILERHQIPRAGFRLDPFLDARARAAHNQRRPRLIIPA